MQAVRSLVFLVLLSGAAVLLSAMELLLFWGPFRWKWAVAVAWADFSIWAGRVICGMDVVTVQERQGEGTDDTEVLAEATRDSRVVLTNDADFLALAARLAGQREPFAPIFFWPQNRRRVGDLVRSIIRE